MKIILPISRKTFSEFKTHVIISKPNDYYSQAHARSSSTIRLQEVDAEKKQAFHNLYAFAEDEKNYPFNICYSTRGDGETIYSFWGYFINHAKQHYAYRSCGGNMHGVFKNLDTNEYFAFYDGARSVFALPHSIEERKNKPVLLETNAPLDMHWWENQADYLIRKGEAHTAKFLAKSCNGIPAYGEDHMCELDAYAHFVRLNPNFDNLIYQALFNNESPETFLLNKYRNKKIKPETLTGKDLTAWNLIDKETQERFLRWN